MSDQKPQALPALPKYVLVRKPNGTPKARFYYQIVDTENNVIISQRFSNRAYVAATINGSHYFGRVELVGKGDHGRYLHNCQLKKQEPQPVAYLVEQ
jgi:hypothetical protein